MFDDALLDDASALAAADPSLRPLAEAGARVRREVAAGLEALSGFESEVRPRAVVAAGNDSRLLRAVLEPWCPVPFVAWPGPGLPGWVGALDAVVVMAQTSGDSSASSAVSEATRRGAVLIVTCDPHSDVAEMAAGRYTTLLPVTTGDPLAAALVALQALHLLGLGPDVDAEAVATALDRVAEECSPFHDIVQNPAKELALTLADVNPLLWGGSVLGARAARRVAEAIRRVSGRSSLAADADHLLPVLAAAKRPDVFADPYESRASTLPPALVILDDGTQDSVVRVQRGRLMTGAEAHGVRVKTLTCDHGPEIARYASLLSQGSYAAAYLGVGLGSDPAAL
ncbi:MAG TPA: SIS domain-containing protein [Nocardioidaceae bacterium]|nr:SIS domain-containing protein [Nocardioidaceae bacterium]